MKHLILLLCLALPVSAGNFVETSAGLSIIDDSVAYSGAALTITSGAITYYDIADTLAVSNWGWGAKPTLKTHYIKGIDTSYVFLRKDCDTTRVTIYEGDSTKPTEIRMNLDDCNNIYRYKIDTSWAELIVFKGTPDELEKLKEILR